MPDEVGTAQEQFHNVTDDILAGLDSQIDKFEVWGEPDA